MERKGLTPKQQRFVDEYLYDLNATQAAIRAGYSTKTAGQQASRLLTNVNIQGEIAAQQRDRAARAEVTKDWVLRRLVSVAERCLQHEEAEDEDGEPTGQFEFQPQAATRALELVGKHLGMFVDRRVVGLKRLEDMTDDELRGFIGDIDDSLTSPDGGALARSVPAGRA